MKKKTKIIIGCAVLALVIIAAAITGIKITDLQRQNTFVDQVNKLSQIVDAEYISDIDRDEFNTFIDSRVCKGKYAKLENSEKSVSAVSGVIDYLAQTKNEWSVEGDKLVFNTKDAAEKYNEAVSALGDAQSNK